MFKALDIELGQHVVSLVPMRDEQVEMLREWGHARETVRSKSGGGKPVAPRCGLLGREAGKTELGLLARWRQDGPRRPSSGAEIRRGSRSGIELGVHQTPSISWPPEPRG